jgi:hypothetical protein
VVVQLGDFGIGMGGVDRAEGYLDTLDATARAADVRLLWLDGNHENYEYLERFPMHRSGLQPVRPHIWRIPRGTRWT